MACDALFNDIIIKAEIECKIEHCDTACGGTEAGVGLSSHCSDERVRVKQEPADLATACDPVEELYAGHEVKEEMVLELELLQPPNTDESIICKDNANCKIEVSLEPIHRHTPPDNKDCDSRKKTETTNDSNKTNTQSQPPSSCESYNQRAQIDTVGTLYRQPEVSRSGNVLKKETFTCDTCKKQFRTSRGLKAHIIDEHPCTDSGTKPFACDVCNKLFGRKSNLSRHQRTHTGEKLFSCDICNNNFICKSHLVEHQRTHTGEKPFSCDVCQKKFRRKPHLIVHRRTHTGEKVFSCDICKKQFNLKHQLIAHHLTHTGEKPFSCDICNKQFGRKAHLIRHQQRTHSVEWHTVILGISKQN